MVLTLTFLAVFSSLVRVARLGALVNFVSHSVVVGFTAGAAVLIATSQMSNIIGVTVPQSTHYPYLGEVVSRI
jgi:SulP family sulfate permease